MNQQHTNTYQVFKVSYKVRDLGSRHDVTRINVDPIRRLTLSLPMEIELDKDCCM
jgi:hypothetical protein